MTALCTKTHTFFDGGVAVRAPDTTVGQRLLRHSCAAFTAESSSQFHLGATGFAELNALDFSDLKPACANLRLCGTDFPHHLSKRLPRIFPVQIHVFFADLPV